MSDEKPIYDGWAILELMGHVRLAGRVTEESHFGVAMGRIDIPTQEGYTTQYFGGSSIYRLTPTTEEIARSVALHNQPAPVRTWELPVAALDTARPGTPADMSPYADDADARGWQQADDEEDDRDLGDEEDEE